MAEAKPHRNTSGADAENPAEIPVRGWRQIARRAWDEGSNDNVSLIAAGVSFYAFSAFVRLLAALVLAYGLVADPQSVVAHMQKLAGAIPSEASQLIAEQLQSMVETKGSEKGLGLILALAIALYGAMKGASAIMLALNIVYEAEESRGFIARNLTALGITSGMVLVMLIAIVAISAMAAIERILPFSSELVRTVVRISSWVGAALAVSLLIAALFRFGPSRPNPRWVWLTPGSITATLLWIAATLGFGFYVSNFGNYNATYGSLGAVIIFLTWLYILIYIVLMCAELNSETERQVGIASPER